MRSRIALLLLAMATPGQATQPADTYGPPPDWDRFKALGEAAVRAKLPQPDLFSIEWPNGYMKTSWRHDGRVYGYATCGILRTTSSVSGFHSVTQFEVAVSQEQVDRVDISSRESNSFVNVICNDLVSKGMLPPASLMTSTSSMTVAALGLTFRASPEGAAVVSVEPGSPAERAHLTPGMIITRANGISLAGMEVAMQAIFNSNAPSLVVETADRQRYSLTR